MDGTDARVTERLTNAAQREDDLTQRLDATMLLLGALCNAYFEETDTTAVERACEDSKYIAWWDKHGSWYRRRIAREEAERRAVALEAEIKRKRIARSALKKLTPAEREALGVSSGKRV